MERSRVRVVSEAIFERKRYAGSKGEFTDLGWQMKKKRAPSLGREGSSYTDRARNPAVFCDTRTAQGAVSCLGR